jgi:hypothetical protein
MCCDIGSRVIQDNIVLIDLDDNNVEERTEYECSG